MLAIARAIVYYLVLSRIYQTPSSSKRTNISSRQTITKIGGGEGIRTPATLSRPPGFQDQTLQPDLSTPPYHTIYHIV